MVIGRSREKEENFVRQSLFDEGRRFVFRRRAAPSRIFGGGPDAVFARGVGGFLLGAGR